jgi:hypothetical protein
LERNFTFSTSACDFLRKNHFDFGRMFMDGIPYLSQKEQREIEEEQHQRENRAANIPEISVPPSDTANLEFVRKARQDIKAWFTNPKVRFWSKPLLNQMLMPRSRRMIMLILATLEEILPNPLSMRFNDD